MSQLPKGANKNPSPQLVHPFDEVMKNRLTKLRSKLKPKQSEIKIKAPEKPKIDYSEVCRKRYADAKKDYNQKLLNELKQLELFQNKAYEAMRFHRFFIITTLWPPLHTRKEIEYVLNVMNSRRTSRQDSRLKELIKYPQF